MKRTKRILALFMAVAMVLTMAGFQVNDVQAVTQEIHITMDDFQITFYDDGAGLGSLWVEKYTGNATEIKLPTVIHYNGKTYQGAGCIGDEAFAGNTTLKKVIIPEGYEAIGMKAFYGCTNLEEVVLGDTGAGFGAYFQNDVFANCPNLKTYKIGLKNIEGDTSVNFGFGMDSSGNIMSGVTAYVLQGSGMDDYLKKFNDKSTGNKIKLVYETNPAAEAKIKVELPGGSTGGNTSGNSGNKNNGSIVPGSSLANTEKAVTAWSSEGDPAGSVFSAVQLKASKVTKSSVKLSWKKVSGATQYVVFGNKCGKKNKYVKLLSTTKTSTSFKKIGKDKVKKGAYYKFIVVAVGKNNIVVSTSKTVHVATKGGKVGNDKKVTLKPKKKSVALGVKKTYKLKAKAVPASKKLKVKRHRKIKFESTNVKVASVNDKGVITGKGKGTCEVYAYAQNGVFAKIKVTVK